MNHRRLPTIIAAACGSRDAIARIIPVPDEGDLFPSHRRPAAFVAALLLLDPDPSPLAATVAASLLDPTPDGLVAIVERNAAAAAQDLAASKRLLRKMYECTISLWNAVSLLAVDAALDRPESRAALTSIAAVEPTAVAILLQRIGPMGWRRLSADQQRMLLDIISERGDSASAKGAGRHRAGVGRGNAARRSSARRCWF